VILDDPLTAGEHLDLGLSRELRGDIDGARREYLAASRKDPSWAAPYFNLGNLARLTGDLSSAEALFTQALERDASNPDILNNLAATKHELGKTGEALILVRKALSIREDPAYLDTLRAIEHDLGNKEDAP